MERNAKLKQVLSILIMPMSLIIAMSVAFVVEKSANVDYEYLISDYPYFYVFSAPFILFFSGGFAITKLWNNEKKRHSVKQISISVLLTVIITIIFTFVSDFGDSFELWGSAYLINPLGTFCVGVFSMFFSNFSMDDIIYVPLYFLLLISALFFSFVLPPILGAALFKLKNKKVKIPAFLSVIAVVTLIGSIGIGSYFEYSVYYDIKGNKYDNPYDVAYYDKDGNTYKIIEIANYYYDSDGNNVKVKSEDKEYYLGECYINEETGLLITDENCEIILPLTEDEKNKKEILECAGDSNIYIYKDKSGNEYRQLANARFDKNGRLYEKFRYLCSDNFTALPKTANADGFFYLYDLKGNRYVFGEDVMFYDAKGNTYKRQSRSYSNTHYDIIDKNGNKTGNVNGMNCYVDSETGYLVFENNVKFDDDKEFYINEKGNECYLLYEAVYDRNGKVTKDESNFYNW